MGIPLQHPSLEGVLVIAGNPFTHTVTILEDDQRVDRELPHDCSFCMRVHGATVHCMAPIPQVDSRIEFCQASDRECRACGRLLNTELRYHFRRSQGCEDGWRLAFYRDIREDWCNLDVGLRNSLTINFVHRSGFANCHCGLVFNVRHRWSVHLRRPTGTNCLAAMMVLLVRWMNNL